MDLTNEDLVAAYIRGYNDAVTDSVKMINASSEALQNMLKTAKEKLKASGFDIDKMLQEG